MRRIGEVFDLNTPHPTSLRSATFSHKGRRQGSVGAALYLLPVWEKVAERSEVG